MTTPNAVNGPAVVWKRFTVALGRLYSLQPEKGSDESLNHFLTWRGATVAKLTGAAASEVFVKQLDDWLEIGETADAARMILLEMEAFTSYIEGLTSAPISQDAAFPEDANDSGTEPSAVLSTKKLKEGFSVAGTILDSMKDFFDKLPFEWKVLLKALSEIADVVKNLL